MHMPQHVYSTCLTKQYIDLFVCLGLRLVLCLQTEIERLKRQIAEKEAAKRAARAQMPTVTKVIGAPPSFLFCQSSKSIRSDASRLINKLASMT